MGAFGPSMFPWRKDRPGVAVTMPPPGLEVTTVAELLTVMEGVDPATHIDWHHEGPEECCPGHRHDITLTVDHIAEVDARSHSVSVTLRDGSV